MIQPAKLLVATNVLIMYTNSSMMILHHFSKIKDLAFQKDIGPLCFTREMEAYVYINSFLYKQIG